MSKRHQLRGSHQDSSLILSAPQVRQQVSVLIHQHLGLKAEGYSCDSQMLSDVLVKASVEQASIEETCADLCAVSSGHTVRNHLNEQLSVEKLTETESKVNAALQADLPQWLWQHKLEMAIDEHDEPFYGHHADLLKYACRCKAKAGTTYFFRVATLYVVHNQVPTTLAIAFVRPEDTDVAIIERLLKYAKALGLRWGCLYLDKGFCSIPVMRYLQRLHYTALIACPIRGKQGGTKALCKGHGSYTTEHTFASQEYGEYAATVAVVRSLTSSGRSRRKRKMCWLVYVQINLALSAQQVRDRYRARFGIEVSYRQMRTTHAKTTSRNAAVRFFLIALAFILVNIWVVLRWRFCQIPRRGGRRLDKLRFSVGRMIRFLRRAIEGVYGTVDQIEAFTEPLSP